METDVLQQGVTDVSEVLELNGGHDPRPVSRRRISLPTEMWKEAGDEADKLDLTLSEYLERLHNSHVAADGDVEIYRKLLEDSAITIEMYRVVMKEHEIPIDGFMLEDEERGEDVSR